MNLLTRIITSVFILLVTGLLSPVISHGQAVLRKDTSTDIVLRKMSVNTLDSLRNDKAFIYDAQSKRVLSAWDRFWMWFWNEVGEIMQRKGYKLGFKILLWTLAVGITLYALVRIFGMEKFVLWMKSDKSNLLEGEVADDNIYGVDFDNEINTAEKKQAYREAVRWLYLKSLRVLSDD